MITVDEVCTPLRGEGHGCGWPLISRSAIETERENNPPKASVYEFAPSKKRNDSIKKKRKKEPRGKKQRPSVAWYTVPGWVPEGRRRTSAYYVLRLVW